MANLVIWPGLLEQQRRVVLGARMPGVDGRVQREGEVVHVVARRLHDLSGLAGRGVQREAAGLEQEPRRDTAQASHAKDGADSLGASLEAIGPKPRDIMIPEFTLEAIRVRPRDFR